MKSWAWQEGRWRVPIGRGVACWVLAPLLILQGCTSGEDSAGAAAPKAAQQRVSRLTSALTEAEVARNAEGAEHVAGQLLVRFRKGAAERMGAAHSRLGAQVVHTYRTQPELQVVAVPEGKEAQALATYRRDPEVEYAEPNYLYRAWGVRTQGMPNDSRFGELWGLHNSGQEGGTADTDLNAPEAWELTAGSHSAGVVTVIDTGIDYRHPDLAANMWVNPGEVPGNGVDDDGNGYVDDIHGINAITNSGDPLDDNGHGTHVSGTIGARGNDGQGVVGVNWQARLMGCKFLSASGGGSLADALKCLDYVHLMRTRTHHPVEVVATNNSWGGGGASQAMYDAIARHRAAGILFIAAAGNSSSDNDVTPAYPNGYFLSNILAVAAGTRTDSLADFSSYGHHTVHITAPGHDILSTVPGGGYERLSGTSMATPHVTGLVALLKAQDPSRDWRQLKNLVLTGGVPHSAGSGRTLTARRLRAADTGGRGSLTCQDQVFSARVRPMGSTVSIPLGDSLQVMAYHLRCDSPAGAPEVTIAPGGGSLTLKDDGRYGDEVAGDGLYVGFFEPPAAGTYTLTFPNGETLTVNSSQAYVRSSVPLAWRTITGTNLGLGDDTSVAITSPFPIPYAAGSGHTTLNVGMNGALSFQESSFAPGNLQLPAGGFTTLVAPLWDDLFPNGSEGNVYWQVLGTEPHRELVIEWRNVHHYGTRSISPPDTATFQVVFFEGSPDILFNYQDVHFGFAGYDRGGGASVGVQLAGGVATSHSYNTPSLEDGSALLWTWPGSSQAPEVRDFQVSPQRLREGESLHVSLDFSDPEGDSDAPWRMQGDLDYPGWFSVDAEVVANAQGPVEASVPATSSGEVTVAARVQDRRGARSQIATARVVVEDVPPALAALTSEGDLNERQAITFRTSFTDPGADAPWRVQWDFDHDGSTFTADRTVTASEPGHTTVQYAFPHEGTFTVAARVVDKDGVASNVQTLEVQVADLKPHLAAITGNTHLHEGEVLQLASSFSDPGDGSSPWKVQWDFNYDGSTFDVDLEEGHTSAGDITLSRFLEDNFTATYALRVVDADGSVSDVQTVQVTCEDVSPVISRFTAELLQGPSEPAVVRFSVNARSGASRSEVDPVKSLLWDFDGDGVFDYASSERFAIHRYLGNRKGGDTYTARLRVQDEDSYSEAEVAVQVLNAPPVLGWMADQTAVEGSLLAVQATGTDPGQDPLTFSLRDAPAGMTMTSNGLLLWTPTYAQGSMAGRPYRVWVIASDDEGARDTREVTFTARWRDEDGDGVADTWERSHDLDPTRNDADEDADGNGVSNRDEFLADTGSLVLPHQPVAESPLSGSRVRTAEVVLTTRSVLPTTGTDPARYQFQLLADKALTHVVRSVTADQAAEGETTSVTLTDGTESEEWEDLEDDHTYYWRVRALEGELHGPWSAAQSFTYDPTNGAPGAPRTTWPMYGSQVSVLQPVLTVDNAEDVDDSTLTYVFELAGDEAFTTVLQRSEPVSGGPGSTWWRVAQPLDNYTQYWWRAIARDDRGGATASRVATFSVFIGHAPNRQPGVAGIFWPASDSRAETRRPPLVALAATDADGDTLTYAMELDTTPAFSSVNRQVSGVLEADAEGKVRWHPEPLAEDTRYYWRVRAMDGLVAGDWAVGSFRVDSTNDAPSTPVPLNPSDSLVLTRRPTFTVQNAVDPEGDTVTYGFEVRTGDGARVIRREWVPQGQSGVTSFTLPVDLQPGTDYMWVTWARDERQLVSEVSAEARFHVYGSRRGGGGGGGCGAAPGTVAGLLPVLGVALGLLGRRRRR
jgi:hypothetical protein